MVYQVSNLLSSVGNFLHDKQGAAHSRVIEEKTGKCTIKIIFLTKVLLAGVIS